MVATPKGGLQHPRPSRVLNLRRIESFNGVEDRVRKFEGVGTKDRMFGLSYDGSESAVAVAAGKARKASSVFHTKL